MKITLIVTGSIAAYKSAELVRELKKGELKKNTTLLDVVDVRVVMTKSASNFVTPLTLQTLSGNKIVSDFFDLEQEYTMNHIDLADDCDLVLVAPASADFIAKLANGLCDDVASTIVLATKAKIIIAPAMNVNMWQNQITKENVQKLKNRGFQFIDPESGELACGWTGEGRLADLETISKKVFESNNSNDAKKKTSADIVRKDPLKEYRVVITAGPTQEMIDPIRFVSNKSSAKMGYALALSAKDLGAEVVLVTGPNSLDDISGIETRKVISALEMKEVLFDVLSTTKAENNKIKQIVFMAAAVTDHKPKNPSSIKLKPNKESSYQIEMVPCPDILSELVAQKNQIEKMSGLKTTIIGFAAETGDSEHLRKMMIEKIEKKGCEIIIGNNASDSFGLETNSVTLYSANDKKFLEIENKSKHEIAKEIIDFTLNYERKKSST